MPFYHKEIEYIIKRWRNCEISNEAALDELYEIEERAYRLIPNAEPDGDITYAIACAVSEILGI